MARLKKGDGWAAAPPDLETESKPARLNSRGFGGRRPPICKQNAHMMGFKTDLYAVKQVCQAQNKKRGLGGERFEASLHV